MMPQLSGKFFMLKEACIHQLEHFWMEEADLDVTSWAD